MMVSVTFRVDAHDVVRAARAAGRLLEPRDILRGVGEEQLKWVVKNFEAEGLEGRWKPLSPTTLARRRKGRGSGPTAKILQDTRRLLMSFNKGATGNVDRLSRNTVEVGSSLVYARAHDQGVPARNLPARPILPSKAKGEEINREYLRALERKFRRAVARRG